MRYVQCRTSHSAMKRSLSYVKRSSEYYTEALQLQPGSPYVYGSWVSASYWLEDYATAWRYVKLRGKMAVSHRRSS